MLLHCVKICQASPLLQLLYSGRAHGIIIDHVVQRVADSHAVPWSGRIAPADGINRVIRRFHNRRGQRVKFLVLGTVDKSRPFHNIEIDLNSNGRPVGGREFRILLSRNDVIQRGLETDAVRAARIARLIEELLGSYRVIGILCFEIFRPLLKGDVITRPGISDDATGDPLALPHSGRSCQWSPGPGPSAWPRAPGCHARAALVHPPWHIGRLSD